VTNAVKYGSGPVELHVEKLWDRNITLTRENLRLQGMVEAYREMLARLQGGQPLDDRLEPRLDGGSEVEAANQGSDGQGGDE